jgi:REP element-mobilizing transposase RayT
VFLSKIVGRFKMITAKQINILQGTQGQPLWQRNYYEHIVRDDESLIRIRQYISDNPAQWEFDHENPAGVVSERRGDS